MGHILGAIGSVCSQYTASISSIDNLKYFVLLFQVSRGYTGTQNTCPPHFQYNIEFETAYNTRILKKEEFSVASLPK